MIHTKLAINAIQGIINRYVINLKVERTRAPVKPLGNRRTVNLLVEPPLPPLATTVTSTFKDQQRVLLQTALAMAYSDIDGSSVPVRVLFNNNSQLSYINDKLQTQLQLKPIK